MDDVSTTASEERDVNDGVRVQDLLLQMYEVSTTASEERDVNYGVRVRTRSGVAYG